MFGAITMGVLGLAGLVEGGIASYKQHEIDKKTAAAAKEQADAAMQTANTTLKQLHMTEANIKAKTKQSQDNLVQQHAMLQKIALGQGTKSKFDDKKKSALPSFNKSYA